MGKNLLIIGAGTYGLVVKEIAETLCLFKEISFIDDFKKETSNGIKVIGTLDDIEKLVKEYDSVIVAIGNPKAKLFIINKVKRLNAKLVSLVSPFAYISSSAKIAEGVVVEPMAVVHTQVELGLGCIVSAGAVINHGSKCGECSHIDCNATVEGEVTVPPYAKVHCGQVFKG